MREITGAHRIKQGKPVLDSQLRHRFPATGCDMSETQRLKMKIGDAEFEADVPESEVEPMYDRFLSMFERRRSSLFRQISTNRGASEKLQETIDEANRDGASVDQISDPNGHLTHIFDLSRDGAVILKVLPKSPTQNEDALVLLLYGYHLLKKEEPVLATELIRAADRSGISLSCLTSSYASNRRFIVRGGEKKGSHYLLNTEGLAIAKEIIATIILELAESASQQTASDAGHYQENVREGSIRVELGVKSRWPGVAGGCVLP